MVRVLEQDATRTARLAVAAGSRRPPAPPLGAQQPSPAITRSSVVFPDPFRPTIPMRRLGQMRRLTPDRSAFPPTA